MTRDELRKIEFPFREYDEVKALFSGEAVLDAMVAAYNQGIEDSVSQIAWDEDNVSHGCLHKSLLEKLKI